MEFIFDDVKSRAPDRFSCKTVICPRYSNGFWPRVINVLSTLFQRADIYHVTGDVHYMTLLLPKRRTVLTIHDVKFMTTASGLRKLALRLFWLSIPIRKSEVITVVSKATKDELLNYVKVREEKVKVIPVAISEKFKWSPKVFNPSKPRILQIGTAPHKNLRRVAEAISTIPCKWVIVGALNQDAIDIINELDIEYENSVDIPMDEMVREYENADIVIFASTYEGFGMPILEAQSVGRPVITSNVLSMPEVAGDGAILVDPYDVAAIRSAVRNLIENGELREQLVNAGRSNARRFSPERIANCYYGVYDNLLNGIHSQN